MKTLLGLMLVSTYSYAYMGHYEIVNKFLSLTGNPHGVLQENYFPEYRDFRYLDSPVLNQQKGTSSAAYALVFAE